MTEICHICGEPRDQPGLLWCSAGHPLAKKNYEPDPKIKDPKKKGPKWPKKKKGTTK